MKLKLFFLILFVGFSSFSSFSYAETDDDDFPIPAEEIEIEGEWNDSSPRSLFSSRPTAFLHGNTIDLVFSKTITHLQVKIIDSKGSLVFEEVISSQGKSTYSIPFSLQEGAYSLILTHRCGVLMGDFIF
ncbi:DUF3244 domain-containing protein [Parabacteroides sp. 52]|uniref:DUF3244 domain-containing protein n=1 Tax=Parabacteroides sp. 52 TaxID=2302940 RepID=UPI0013D6EAAB|nr:DUF3244 domain-containing protein [Parabacteroides sp. 52]NDV55793.1 DUF3244 domain-containing protein [Parabacteroides sp. 52]